MKYILYTLTVIAIYLFGYLQGLKTARKIIEGGK